jgi:hypothetical protein
MDKVKGWVLLLGVLIAVFAPWVAFPFFMPLLIKDWNQIGDTYGAVNALFSGLALGGGNCCHTVPAPRASVSVRRNKAES